MLSNGLEPQLNLQMKWQRGEKRRSGTLQRNNLFICDRGLGKSKIIEFDDNVNISIDVNTLASTPTPTTISMLQPIASAILLIMVSIFFRCHATGVCKCMSSP